ncbi:hypothetical protein FQN60_017173 [Etheostoma spectabile]|uniref:Uncharacterized protein n=1 Tax=Etheostoma spectabile TaxID=54343 RepID=A0A5J5DEP9_9PERO|nr:hypothetical protein FQN60_017173 [Etheostoma spectabile]
MDEPMKSEGGGGRRGGGIDTAVSSKTALFSPQSYSHSDYEFLGSLTHYVHRPQGCCQVFSILSVDLEGVVGMAHMGSW